LFSHLSQRRINENKPPLTTRLTDVGSPTLSASVNLQTFLYSNYTTHVSSMFYDIVTGTTTLHTDANLGPLNNGKTFSAGTGYDIATGLGVPQMNGIQERMFLTTDTIQSVPTDTIQSVPTNPPISVPTSTPSAPTPSAPTPSAPVPNPPRISAAFGGMFSNNAQVYYKSHTVSSGGGTVRNSRAISRRT
jgi:hypothetical protein